jgi:hypothetical protein
MSNHDETGPGGNAHRGRHGRIAAVNAGTEALGMQSERPAGERLRLRRHRSAGCNEALATGPRNRARRRWHGVPLPEHG